MTLATATAVYHNVANGKIILHRVQAEAFHRFSVGVSALSRAIQPDDHRGRLISSWLKRVRFVLSAAPVSFQHPFEHCLDLPPLREWEFELKLSYPAERALIAEVFGAIQTFADDGTAPLRTRFEDLLLVSAGASRVAVVSPDTSLLSCFDDEAAAAGAAVGVNLQVMGQLGLRDDDLYDELFLFGSASWFKWHVFGAPKAPVIHLVQYAWIPGGVPTGPSLHESSLRSRVVARQVEIRGGLAQGIQLPPEDVRGKWIEEEGQKDDRTINPSAPAEDARLVVLEAGYGVYLPTSDDSVIVIDDTEDSPEVRRIPVTDLETGMHIVLRTVGAADYVREVADAALGEKARVLRLIESAWKAKLADVIERDGEDAVAADLRKEGLTYASRESVRRWRSSRNIGTKTEDAFSVLMKHIGLEDRSSSYWANAEQLWAAHRSAGLAIRSLLLEVLRGSDLTSLRRYGRMDFELDTPGAGTLTAFTVREISEKVRPVISGRLGRPFEMRAAYSWLD